MLKPVFCVIAALASTSIPARAADPVGLWRTPRHNGLVEIMKCGGGLCGRIVSSDDIQNDPGLKDVNNPVASLRARPIKGLTVLTGFSGGPTEWVGGKIYNVEDGKTYSGTISFDGADALKLKGCLVAPICGTQHWTRAR
ncbi:DUF2147 domain-containing protein [Methylobacterium sp. ID0610]|uniref:DUF2147 domain-containing protein n=1 Tax=Methylobacterium carpenticola TaxID=3344827 RepID=UPI0036A757A2